jgi:cytochrome P450
MASAPEIDYVNPAILSNPFDFYQHMQAHSPVIKVKGQDLYCVFSSALIKEVLRDTANFSNQFGDFMTGRRKDDPEIKAITAKGWPFVETLLTADAPVHTRFRKLVNMAFSKPRIDAMEAHIRSISDRLLDQVVAAGHCDFVQDFAIPFPVEVISGQVGLAHIEMTTVKRWTTAIADRLGGVIDRDREIECAKEIVDFQQTAMAIIQQRRITRADDLLSDLVEASVDGERPLDDVEILSILQQLMAAGNDTSTAALIRGLLLLVRNPEQQAIIRADPALLPNMVEEMLRTESPGQSIFRITTGPVTLGGVDIPANSMLMVVVGAANRDAEAFDRADAFDVRRSNPHTHLAFGRGIHACVGSSLARRELLLAFKGIFARMDDIRIADGADATLTPHLVAPTLTSLPIVFRPIAVPALALS